MCYDINIKIKIIRCYELMAKYNRFIKIYGATFNEQIWVDRETGVNYLVMQSGVCPLIDACGKPIITPQNELPATD